MITTHQYLAKYPVSMDSEKLIVGTIHPHHHSNFIVKFFYGNKLSMWRILNDAFNHEMGDPITLEGITEFLNNHKISVSDTIKKCRRLTASALDKDLVPLELNTELVDQVRSSKITQILFTSGFQKNNAFKLFYEDMLGLKITPEIRRSREVVLNKSIFGRPVKLTILYSPSGSSNVPLSKSELYILDKHKYVKSHRPVYDFKVDYSRDKFITN